VIEAPRQALSPGQGKADAGAIELLRLSGLEELHIEAPLEENPQRILRDQPEAAVRERR
jgi:hypothetical protein